MYVPARVKDTKNLKEASVLREFHAGLDDMLAGKTKSAKRAFEKVLQNPMVAVFHQEDINWEIEHDDK